MKRILLTLICQVILASVALSQQVALDNFLKTENYYMLNREFIQKEKSLTEYERLLYAAFILSAYNQPEASNNKIKQLFGAHNDRISGSVKAGLYEKRIANNVRLFDYPAALQDSNLLIEKYSSLLTKERLDDIKNSSLIWIALKDVGRQRSLIQRGDSIELTKDKAGLWNVPVGIGDTVEKFIFDTGANFSVVSESIAIKNGWKIRSGGGFDVGSATGMKVKSNIAVVDSIAIGKSVFRNVLFLVMPDEALTIRLNPLFTFSIKGIIGFPVISKFDEIEIHNSGSLKIPPVISVKHHKNFAIPSGMPILYAAVKNEVLGFNFDTGATKSSLFKTYLDKYPEDFRTSKTVSKSIGGAGGSKQIEVFQMESLTFQILNEPVTVRNVSVHREIKNKGEMFSFGNLGQDVFKQFSYFTMNFRDMYIEMVR